MTLAWIAAVYLLVFLWVSGSYLRHRDPLLIDVMLIFGAVSMNLVPSLIRLLWGEPPEAVLALSDALVLGQPFFTLHLVSRLRRVPPWAVWGAALASAACVAAVFVLTPPLPAATGWLIVSVMFGVEAVAAALLASEARRRGGAARTRLGFAAAGTALFGVVFLTAGAHERLRTVLLTLAGVSALMYLLAFAPPRSLRRLWSWGAAYAVIRALVTMPADHSAEQTWRRYCEGARGVLGADAVAVLVPGKDGAVRVISEPRSALDDESYPAGELDALLRQAACTIDALAGWTRPPRLAVDLAHATGTRFVRAAPRAVDGGALVMLRRYRTLFADDDVTLFSELGGQAAVLADRAEVLEEQQRLVTLVESSDDAIIGKTPDGIVTSWNGGARQLYGYAAEEVIGRHAAMLFPAGQEQTETRILERVGRGERIIQYETEQRRKDGGTTTVSLTSSLVRDVAGNPLGVACVARDISERLRAEAMFRGLLEAAPDAMLGVTEDGRITLINREAERMFGYPRDELLGQSIGILVPPRARPRDFQRWRDYFLRARRRPGGPGKTLHAVCKDGVEFPVEVNLSTLETDEGVTVCVAVRDVTDRVQAQAERERLAAQAERDAAERRLQHTRRLESLGQLAGGVAHDFNNILAVIASYTELLLETLSEPVPAPADLAAARTDLGQISRATERATRLTKQLLAFGRREITNAQVLILNHVVGDVEQMLRRTLGEHIHLITHLDRDLWPTFVDPGQFEQILVNLAVNARDAMPSGGTLSIDTANTRLDDADVAEQPSLEPGRYVRVRVSDTGCGMPPEVAERAFEPFFTTKPQGAGTGLGLATVYGIATAAGGHVRILSEPGIGTTVTIVLPASDAEPVAARAEGPAAGTVPAPEAPRETILLVEDEDALREATGRTLTRAGYRVLVANGGPAALRLVEEHSGPIDLLLTDVLMPVMMGNEVAARVGALRPGIAVLYMSGYAQPVLTENGTLPAGVEIVEKPFTRDALLERVRARLHRIRPQERTAVQPGA
ncbi:PAS domain-containing hybrid sensor histidine kinase/response regulator [Pseudosporangium ferrugineum]|uniref:histidine kinase n=1 Tax=Pseudosporangium ferrugineum TaxID=439699 RepID=A0A2T0S8Z8_9ACTN|nr:PAS domain-containing hybrid sensor histidine kinase/response regulator [Pseudosporangium ferrugineum]PRY29898.1 PAS domain S-box-containing protein [Pseudosporangium ferrugineum]